MQRKLAPALLLSAAMMTTPALAADLTEIRSLVAKGRTAEALAGLDSYLAGNPEDSEAMFLRGFVLAENRQQRSARAIFEDVSQMEPDRAEPLNNLAVIQAAMGDYETAVETLKAALGTDPTFRIVYENLTKIYGQLASEAYSRALNVAGAHDRSAVELTLLSEMETAQEPPVLVASSEPAEPIEMAPPVVAAAPSASPPVPAVAEEPAAAEVETPGEAIEEALTAEQESIDEPIVEQQPAMESQDLAVAPADLANLVEAWARAWSEQRVDDYLYFYASSFTPTGELSRQAWEDLRRERLAAPEFIKVSVAFLDFEINSSESALVRFNQSYESDTFSDVVTKTLDLVRENGEWKIQREAVGADA